MKYFIDNAAIVLENSIAPRKALLIENGVIKRVLPAGRPADIGDEEYFDAKGAYLAPGFIDLHIHGIHKHLVDDGPAEVAAMARILPRYGVTSFLPTVCPLPVGQDTDMLRELVAGAPEKGSNVLGYHLEGPFLKLTGAISPDSLGSTDPARVRSLIEALDPYPAIFSIAPDVEGIVPCIEIMAETGAPIFITHTQATVRETQEAIAAGACHATHFYDVFPVPAVSEGGVRPCGAVEAILADPTVSVDFILDGVHVDPVALQMALQCKGPDRVCLVTDAMVGAGLPPAKYLFGNREVYYEALGKPARMLREDGTLGGLSGSGLVMNLAVKNAIEMAGVSLPMAVRMASTNPAQTLRIADRKGRIQPGYDADLTLFDEEFSIIETWVGGVPSL